MKTPHDWKPERVQPYNEIVCACETCGVVKTEDNADLPCPGNPADRALELGSAVVLAVLLIGLFFLLLAIQAAKQ